jgi:hypothetical protein
LNEAHAHLIGALERFAAFAAIGDRFTKLPDEIELPDVGAVMRFGQRTSDPGVTGLSSELSDVRQNFAAYCGRYSVIGMITASELYLHRLLFLVRLGELAARSSGDLLGEQFNETRESIRKEIRRSSVDSLPATMLAAVKEPESKIAQMPYFRGIYAARRCLLHRGGLVGQDDVDVSGKLSVSWQRVAISAGDTVIDALPYKVTGDTLMSFEIIECSRTWAIGQALSLTVQDCQDIAMTLSLFASSLMQVVGEGIKTLITDARSNGPRGANE